MQNSAAAQPTASTGVARDRASSGCSRIWRMTIRMRIALIRYMVMLFMPSACPPAPVRGVGPRVGVRADTQPQPLGEPFLRTGGSLQCRRGPIRPPSTTASPRHELARSKAIRAVRELDTAGTTVTFESVARAAGMSRSWLYTQPDIRDEVLRLRGLGRRAPGTPARHTTAAATPPCYAGCRPPPRVTNAKSASVAPAPRTASSEDTVYSWAGRRVHRSSSRLPGPYGSKNLSSSSITASSAAAALLSSSTLGLSCPLGRSHGLSDRRVPGPLAAIGRSRPTTPISSRMTPTMCKFRPGTAFAVTANHKIAPTAIRERAVPVLSARHQERRLVSEYIGVLQDSAGGGNRIA